LPVGPWEDAGNIIVAVESAASFRSLIRSGRVSELTDPLGQIAGYVNEQYSAADYLQALKVREIAQKKMDSVFETFDVLAAAAQPVPATPLTLNLETDLAFPDPLGGIGNICGLPAMSVPCGFTEKNLPVGCNLWAEPAMILPLSRQGGPSSCIPTGTRNIRRSIRNRSAILDHNESRRLVNAIEWVIVAKNDCT